MQKFLDLNGLSHFWDKVKNYIDSNSSSGSFGNIVQWEDINGRPDLSDVSSMKVAQIVLLSSLWIDNTQTITVDGISADENAQLIIPIPKAESKSNYDSAGISCDSQVENTLIFSYKTVPVEDIKVNVFIIGAAVVSDEYVGEFEWWSPHMTSNNSPAPYAVSASSIASASGAGFHAFDGSIGTIWDSGNVSIDQYLIFDYGSNMIVDGIRTFTSTNPNWNNRHPKSISILGSNDNSVWTKITKVSMPNEIEATHVYEFMFEKPVKYRYIKILCDKNYYYGDYKVFITDIEFHKLQEATQ